MKIGRDGFNPLIYSDAEFKRWFQAKWYKGRIVYESKLTLIEGIYIAKKHEDDICLVPYPPMYKVNIRFNPKEKSGYVLCSINISEATQDIINKFISNVFNEYHFDEAKEYHVHVRLDSDWELRKVSVINCIGHEEDEILTILLGGFFKNLAQGKDIGAFLTRLNLQKLLSEHTNGTMG